MAERFLILGAGSFYGSNFARLVEASGDVAIRCRRYGPIEECDYVVNFCSKSLVAESWADPSEWVSVNAGTFSTLLDVVKDMPIKRFIHVSTPESYGHTERWVDEDYRDWKPSTPYAVSRAAADMMLMAYYRAYGFPGIITRTANIYGLGQGANRFIPMAFEALRSGRRLDLHGGGETIRSFIHVSDACAGLYKVAKEGDSGLTYHISTDRFTSIRQLAMTIGVSIGEQPDRLGKDLAYLLKSDRLRGMGWRPTIPLEQGISEYGTGSAR